MAQQYLTQSEIEAAKKAQKKKIVIGVAVLLFIIIMVVVYNVMMNDAMQAESTSSLVNKPKIDSVHAPVVADKSMLLDAQKEKAKKDSLKNTSLPKSDSVMKM